MEDQISPSCGPYTHACAHPRTCTHTCIDTHAHTRPYAHACAHTHMRTRVHALLEKKGAVWILQELGVETGPLSQLNRFLSSQQEVWRSWGTLCQQQMQAQGWETLVLGFTSLLEQNIPARQNDADLPRQDKNDPALQGVRMAVWFEEKSVPKEPNQIAKTCC